MPAAIRCRKWWPWCLAPNSTAAATGRRPRSLGMVDTTSPTCNRSAGGAQLVDGLVHGEMRPSAAALLVPRYRHNLEQLSCLENNSTARADVDAEQRGPCGAHHMRTSASTTVLAGGRCAAPQQCAARWHDRPACRSQGAIRAVLHAFYTEQLTEDGCLARVVQPQHQDPRLLLPEIRHHPRQPNPHI